MILYIIATVTMFNLNNGYDLINDTSKRIQNGTIDIFNIKTMSYFTFSLFTMIGRQIFFIIFGIIVLVSCCILNNNYMYIIVDILMIQTLFIIMASLFLLIGCMSFGYSFLNKPKKTVEFKKPIMQEVTTLITFEPKKDPGRHGHAEGR